MHLIRVLFLSNSLHCVAGLTANNTIRQREFDEKTRDDIKRGKMRDQVTFENEVIKKLNAKRFLKDIYKSERRFGATLRHYQVKK